MKKAHAKKISEGQKKSWRKGGPSRLAYERRMRKRKRV